MIRPPLLHPSMITSQPGTRVLGEALVAQFYPSLCTIQQATVTRDEAGQPINTWADVAGLVDLPCALATLSGGELKQQTGDPVVNLWRLALSSYQPTIAEEMQAVVDGVAYDLMGVDSDSHQLSTYLTLRQARP